MSEALDVFESHNKGFREAASTLLEKAADFHESLQKFEEGKQKWSVFLRGGSFFSDDETEDMRIILERLKVVFAEKMQKMEAKQASISIVGNQLNESGDFLIEKTLSEKRDRLNQVADREDSAQGATKKNQDAYERLESEKRTLMDSRYQMFEYSQQMRIHYSEMSEKQEDFYVTQAQLSEFSGQLSGALAHIDLILEGDLPESQRRQLEEKKDELLEHSITLGTSLATVEQMSASTTVAVDELETSAANAEVGLLSIDEFLGAVIDPSLVALTDSLIAIETAKLSYGDAREQIEADYFERLGQMIQLDQLVADSVINHNLDNQNLFEELKVQHAGLEDLKIRRPTLWHSTGGLLLTKIGEGWNLLTKQVICKGLDLAQDGLIDMTEDIPVLNVVTATLSNVVLGFPSGVLEGVGELVEGVTTMINHPIRTFSALGALVGREPGTGKWSSDNAHLAWIELGKALSGYDHFADGKIGKGIGKVAFNVILTATGAGAAGKAGSVAKLSYGVGRAGGRSVLVSSLLAARTGGYVFVTEFGTNLARIPGESLSSVGRMFRYMSKVRKPRLVNVQSSLIDVSSQLRQHIDDLSKLRIGGTEIHSVPELMYMSADDLARLSPDELIRFGVTDAKSARDFLRFVEGKRVLETLTRTRTALVAEKTVLSVSPEMGKLLGPPVLEGEALMGFVEDFNKQFPHGHSDRTLQKLIDTKEGILCFDEAGKLRLYTDEIAFLLEHPTANGSGLSIWNLRGDGLQSAVDLFNQRNIPTPSRAYEVFLNGADEMVGFDKVGKLQIFKRRYTVESSELITQTLSSTDIGLIEAMWKEHVAKTTYNNAGMTLEFVRFLREARVRNPHLRLDDALAMFEIDGIAVVDKYGGGNCFALSQSLLDELHRSLQVEGGIMGNRDFNVAMRLDGSPWVDGLNHVERSHGSIVIKYIEAETGATRYMHLEMGTGTDIPVRFLDDVDDLKVSGAGDYQDVGRGVSNLNNSVMKNHLQTRNEFTIIGEDGFTKINLLEGSIFVNGKEAEAISDLAILDSGSFNVTHGGSRVTINVREMINNPSKMTHIMLPDGPMLMTNQEALYVMLRTLGERFKQPSDFADNLQYLFYQTPEYYSDFMLPGARQAYRARTAVEPSLAQAM